MWPLLADLPTTDDFEPEAALAERAATPGLYLLFADGPEPVYVGQSRNIRVRLATHRREGKKVFHTARFYPVGSEQSRLILETVLIALLRPPLNRGLMLGIADGRLWEIKWPGRKRRS